MEAPSEGVSEAAGSAQVYTDAAACVYVYVSGGSRWKVEIVLSIEVKE